MSKVEGINQMQNNQKRNICGGKIRPAIDVTDDNTMVLAGIRVAKCDTIPNKFKKTKEERDTLKRVKNKYSPGSVYMDKDRSVGKLTIYLQNKEKKKDFKTTECFHDVEQSEVRDILKRFEDRKYVITKHYFTKTKRKY